jgi:signal transduction histidine kinase
MRLRAQLLMLSITLIAVPAAISFGGFYLMSRWAVPAMKDSVEQRTYLELDRLVHDAVAPLAAEDGHQVSRLLATLGRDPSFSWAVVIDDRGRQLAAYADSGDLTVIPEPPAATRTIARSVASDGAMVVGWAPIEVEGLVLGRVGIGYRMTRAAQVATWNTTLGIAAALATVVGIAFAIAFSRRFVRPIERMKQFAAAVTNGDLAHRIASTDGSELGELANHLDTMTAALEARDAELTLRRADLERAVAEVRSTQGELMRSSRLAAVGEMAGRTAHEVLNPAQSLHGRLARMTTDDLPAFRHNSEVLAAIVAAWRDAATDGPDGLLRTLAEPVDQGTALDADLIALDQLVAWNREAAARADADLSFLVRELDRITRIVDGMRRMTRQSSSASRHTLGPILAEACEIVRDSTTKRRIEVRWTAQPGLLVDADRYELLQILTNLLRNAMPAIEERHGRAGGHIELVAELRAGRLAIEVRDDGNGIAAEHLPLIFEPSFTTRSVEEGTGLGLAISRRLVRQMAGDLTVAHTAIGRGTTFLIDLPAASAQSAEPPNDSHARDHHHAA